jgi:hypothetical protein
MKLNNSYPQLSEIIKTRPKSFSEGYGVINQFPAYENKNEIYQEIPDKVPVEKPDLKNDYLEIIYNKIVGFIFHLVLIATFELIFFNYYIIQYENNAVTSLSTQLVQPIINETTINNNALSDKNIRENNNNYLNTLSYIYYSGLILIFLFVLLTNCIIKKKINFVMIFIDNVIMICILGIYEYLFFKHIIFKYLTLGPNELIKNIMGDLLNNC